MLARRFRFDLLAFVSTTAFLMLLGGCAGIGAFSMTEESNEIIIPGSLLGSLADLFPTTIPMEINLEQELAAHDATGARSVYLTELRFVITDTRDPDGSDNFDFLDRVNIHVASTKGGTSLANQEVAWINSVPDGEREIFLDVDSSVDLKPYIEEGVRLQSQAQGSTPRNDVSMKVFATFRVNVL